MITLAGLGDVVVVRRLSLLRSPGKETGRDSKGPRMRGRGGIPRAALCWGGLVLLLLVHLHRIHLQYYRCTAT